MLLGINHSFIYDFYIKEPTKAPESFYEICDLIAKIQILKIGLEALKSWSESIAEQAKTAREDYKQKIRNNEDLNWEETLKMRRFEADHLIQFSSLTLHQKA